MYGKPTPQLNMKITLRLYNINIKTHTPAKEERKEKVGGKNIKREKQNTSKCKQTENPFLKANTVTCEKNT